MANRKWVKDPILKVRGLTKRFGDIVAVDNVDFEISSNSIVGLIGQNGSGKTSIITMLLGVLVPSSGNIVIFDEPMPRKSHKVLSRLNFSSPYVDLPKRLTVYENLTVYAHLYGLRSVKHHVKDVARMVGVSEFLERRFGDLSTGQRARVGGLAKALINEPEFLLLDDPTASLDPGMASWIRQILIEYVQRTGAAILFSSHNMAEVESLCDFVLIMNKGRIVDRGSIGELLSRNSDASLEEVFVERNSV